MKLPIHVSHQSAAQLLWSATRVCFNYATNNVYGSVTQLTCEMHFQLCNRLSSVSMLLFSVKANELPLENEVPTLSWKLSMNILQPEQQVIFGVMYGSFTTPVPPFSTHSTPVCLLDFCIQVMGSRMGSREWGYPSSK